MKTNEAGWDRTIRIVLGLALVSLTFGPGTSSIEPKDSRGPGISR